MQLITALKQIALIIWFTIAIILGVTVLISMIGGIFKDD